MDGRRRFCPAQRTCPTHKLLLDFPSTIRFGAQSEGMVQLFPILSLSLVKMNFFFFFLFRPTGRSDIVAGMRPYPLTVGARNQIGSIFNPHLAVPFIDHWNLRSVAYFIAWHVITRSAQDGCDTFTLHPTPHQPQAKHQLQLSSSSSVVGLNIIFIQQQPRWQLSPSYLIQEIAFTPCSSNTPSRSSPYPLKDVILPCRTICINLYLLGCREACQRSLPPV